MVSFGIKTFCSHSQSRMRGMQIVRVPGRRPSVHEWDFGRVCLGTSDRPDASTGWTACGQAGGVCRLTKPPSKILVFGGRGMLGHKLVQVLGANCEVWTSIKGEFSEIEHFGLFSQKRT